MKPHLDHINREGEHAWWLSLTRGDRYSGQLVKGWWSGPWDFQSEIEFALGGEDNMAQIRVSLPFIGHAAVGVRVPRRWTRGWIYERREWSVTGPDFSLGRWITIAFAHDQGLDGMASYYRRLRERGEPVTWSRAATWPGWEWSFRPRLKDHLLGRMMHSKEVFRSQEVTIPMPEGEYPATATLERHTWKRSRWSKARSVDRWDIEVPGGLPIPGKGENSWDCGDDATFSMSFPADDASVAEAIAHVQADTLKTRARRAGASWVPSDGWRVGRA